MIITEKKNIEELLENVKDYKSIFLIGCSECATLCGTGGEPELNAMKEALEANGKEVRGTFVAKTGCQVLGTKVELKGFTGELSDVDCVIVLSCGAGTQSAVELFPKTPVYPANNSLFLGNMTRLQMFDERCSLCGECILDKTGGICPLTACPKGLLNGPCGGTNEGNCEISPDIKCAWVRIYERMENINRLDTLKSTVIDAKDWSRAQKPRALSTREEKKKK